MTHLFPLFHQVDEVVKKQISWFFAKAPDGGGAAAGGGGAAAKGGRAGAALINTKKIDDATFFGFDRNERDDLLHMYASARHVTISHSC